MADGSANAEKFANLDGLQFGWRKRLTMILQTEAAECGLACLAMIASYHGHEIDLASLRRRYPASLKGTSLSRLIDISGRLGFNSRPLKLELSDLGQLHTPCVMHWDLNHFVVLKEVTSRGVVIHDPARGVRKLNIQEVSQHFTGVALELGPGADFEPIVDRQAVSFRALTGTVRGLGSGMMQILGLALALEVFTLVAPFYLQWVLDQVLVSADHDLMTLLGMGFIAVTIFSSLISAARSWAIVWLGSTLNVQSVVNLFHHLVRLPLDWYEKRHIGDVVSRFGSLQSIQKTFTTQFVDSLLDGLMSLMTLIAMGLYSLWLSLLVAGIFLVYGLARWCIFRPLRQANEEQIVYAARQQSELLESIRGVVPIKLANKQHERTSRYTNASVAATNRDIGIQRLTIAFTLVNQLLFGVGRTALIWMAAALALKSELTVGAMVAFIAYADQFISRSSGLIDKLIDFRMLRLHLERVADIALAAPEKMPERVWDGPEPTADIELVNVSFRYAEDEPWLLRNCCLRIEAGVSAAIVGPSGCGKSTLVKLVLGLLAPTEGELRFGGVDIRKLGLEAYREWTSAVMQSDQLFAGSIAENISFFDPNADMRQIIGAALAASIHEDISRMPMGYQSLVGDMGSSLSGGQKQRIILARAFYRQPRLLVLDEATSFLDVERERTVNASIMAMNTTRLIVAHRKETIASADVVFRLENGILVEADAVS